MTTASPATYGIVTKTFHWLTALLILTVAPLGAIAYRLPYETNEQLALKAQLFSLHKTLGIVVFLVALARIVWALTQPKPGPLHPEKRAETFLASLVHWLLYISLVAVPLTGWIHHAATEGFAPILLPISQELPLVPNDEAVAVLFGGLHWAWSKILMACIILHILGALKHVFIDRDATLRRMWFGHAEVPNVAPHARSNIAPFAAIGIYAAVTAGGAAAGIYTGDVNGPQASLAAVASDWEVTEGDIEISITQLGSPVSGTFGDWTSSISFNPEANGVMGDVTTTIAIGSLSLGTVTSDALGTNFFDAEQFPTATFTAEITSAENGFIADGTLTIKDISVPLQMPFALDLNDETAVMSANLTLDRRDFGIGDNMSDESNLGFAVDVIINLTALRANE